MKKTQGKAVLIIINLNIYLIINCQSENNVILSVMSPIYHFSIYLFNCFEILPLLNNAFTSFG